MANKTAKRLPFAVEQNHRNVITLRMDGIASGWEQWFLLSSDRHHDNTDTDQALERKHLEEAKERNAGVIDIGDCFCAMQGKYDKRGNKSKLRPEHVHGNYLDRLVETAADFYGPYAPWIIQLSPGNHETSILKNHETNLTERLVERLNAKHDGRVKLGGYSGWVRFLFTRNKTGRESKNLFYHHGFGGGGPVTRGVIQTNRMAVYLPDADFVLTGHTHDEWIFPLARTRLSELGVPYHDEALHLRCPSYKDEFQDGHGGWAIEKGMPPKPKGALWLRFYLLDAKIRSEVTRAK